MRRCVTFLKRFWRADHGLAATEFALCLPLLMAMLLTGFEMSRFLLINQKVDKIAYTMADVVAQTQSGTLTTAQLNMSSGAAAQIMQPFTFGASGVVLVTSVSRGSGTSPPTLVRWRYSGGGTLARSSVIGTVGSTATLPNSLTLNNNENVIVAEVYYRYVPLFSAGMIPERDVYRTAIFKPRLGALTTPPV